MDIFRDERRTYEIHDYIHYLNKKVAESKNKEKLTDDDKLARVLLFNIEHYQRYENERGMTLTMYILDHYTKIVQDEDDIFRRPKIEFHIPAATKRNLFSDYRDYVAAIKAVVTADEEELQRLMEEGQIDVVDMSEKDDSKDQPKKKTFKGKDLTKKESENEKDSEKEDTKTENSSDDEKGLE